MKYHTLFFKKLEKMSPNLSSAAIVIGAFRVKYFKIIHRGAYMSAHILLNLLSELGKVIKCVVCEV